MKKVENGMQMFRLALVAAFSRPFRPAVTIRFTLPYSGVNEVRFTIVDIKGRTVWNRSLFCGNAAGIQEIIWNGSAQGRKPVVAGIYLLRMAAFDGKRNLVAAFQKKIWYLP